MTKSLQQMDVWKKCLSVEMNLAVVFAAAAVVAVAVAVDVAVAAAVVT